MSLRTLTLLNVTLLVGIPAMVLLRPLVVLFGAAGTLFLCACTVKLRSGAGKRALEEARARKATEEMSAYDALNVALTQEEPTLPAARTRGKRICRTIVDHSPFGRVMMLQRMPEGRLVCAGSAGVDDLTIAAVERWAEIVVADEVAQEERLTQGSTRRELPVTVERQALLEMPPPGSLAGRSGATNVAIRLGAWHDFDPDVGTWELSGRVERRQWRRAIVFPIRVREASGLRTGRLAGAIVICQDGIRAKELDQDVRVDRLIAPLEMLASRLGQAAESEVARTEPLQAAYTQA